MRKKKINKKTLAGHHSGGTSKCILSLQLDQEEAGQDGAGAERIQNVKSLELKIRFLGFLPQVREQLREIYFPKVLGPLPATQ